MAIYEILFQKRGIVDQVWVRRRMGLGEEILKCKAQLREALPDDDDEGWS
jgi:hypothetical protein